jgi:hypothetical protein
MVLHYQHDHAGLSASPTPVDQNSDAVLARRLLEDPRILTSDLFVIA